MADDVEMTPVEASEPPKANPLAAPVAPKVATLKLNPMVRKPVVGGTPTAALKPGLKLPPKPGMAAGLKLPPKPATMTATLKPGMKLPTVALKPGIKLPAKPVIRKPGATVTAMPLPKPVEPQAEKSVAAETPMAPVVPAAPVASVAPAAVPPPPSKPVAVDAQGVGKLPTVEAKAVDRTDTAPTVSANPNPLEALKSVTQKLKGITQEIPQQAILRKTGIIAEGAMSEAQKEAAKHKTARISLSDAMGVAPVKNENAPMKTIRIKRPVGITEPVKPAVPAEVSVSAAEPSAEEAKPVVSAEPAAPTVTQRKTLKIARPGGAVRPSGKFGIKRPSQATTIVKAPGSAAEVPPAEAGAGEPAVAEIADIPDMPVAPAASAASVPAGDGPAWLVTLSTVVQAAACVAIGALAWFLYQNTQIAYF